MNRAVGPAPASGLAMYEIDRQRKGSISRNNGFKKRRYLPTCRDEHIPPQQMSKPGRETSKLQPWNKIVARSYVIGLFSVCFCKNLRFSKSLR